jgi:hypothetical protein
MAARTSYYLLVFLVFFTVNCKERKESFIQDGMSHYILYTDPSSDCFSCNTTGLKILNSYISQGNLQIYLKPSKDNERFKIFLSDSFKERGLTFYEINLEAPHPSILLVRGKLILMYFCIPKDPLLLEEMLSLCRDFFLSQDWF